MYGIEKFGIPSNAAVIALHSCGVLTDKIIEKAILSLSPVAIMPCCYNQNMREYDLQNPPDKRKLMYKSENDYYDTFRMQHLRENGYLVFLRTVNPKITPMNNVIIAIPA